MNRNRDRIPLFFVLALALVFSGCLKKNKLPTAVPTSNQVGYQGLTKSYDDSAGSSRMLKLQYFETLGANHTITLVSEDGSIPGTEPVEYRNRGAITAGLTAWKITISQEGNDWLDGIFGYNFSADPDLRTDPQTPPCWRGGIQGEGQDWSAYTNFQCDIWCDPESPVWAAGGWWLSQVLVYDQNNGDLWANEQSLVYPTDYDFLIPDDVLDRRPCGCQYSNYYQQSLSLSGTDFRPGHNSTMWRFDNVLDRQSNLSPWGTENRWTRQAGVRKFWFVMGGSVTGMKVGSSFFIDNPRVVRSEKPEWEGKLDTVSFAETFPWVPAKSSTGTTSWTATGSGALAFTNVAGWANAQKWDYPAVPVVLNAGQGAAVTLLDGTKVSGGVTQQICAPGDLGPVTLYLKYRVDDPKMALLVDYSVDGTNNGIIANGPVTLAPGDTAWHRERLRVAETDPWDMTELINARLFFMALDLGGSVAPQVEVDMALLAGRPCANACYSPYNADYALGWPDWRK